MKFPYIILIFMLLITFPSRSLLAQGSDGNYLLIYSIPHAYPDSGWIDSRALYVKENLDNLFFYIEFYGSMPTTSRDWRRQVSILIDSDRDHATGQRYKDCLLYTSPSPRD